MFVKNEKPILVVGAGVSGLQTARALLKRGFQVVVLEQSEDVGGVWIRNYQGYGLQVPWELYQFPEFPYPRKSELSEYPSGEAVRDYVQAYARHFDLYRHILFSCRLISLRRKRPPQQTGSGVGAAGTAASAVTGARGGSAEAAGGVPAAAHARGDNGVVDERDLGDAVASTAEDPELDTMTSDAGPELGQEAWQRQLAPPTGSLKKQGAGGYELVGGPGGVGADGVGAQPHSHVNPRSQAFPHQQNQLMLSSTARLRHILNFMTHGSLAGNSSGGARGSAGGGGGGGGGPLSGAVSGAGSGAFVLHMDAGRGGSTTQQINRTFGRPFNTCAVPAEEGDGGAAAAAAGAAARAAGGGRVEEDLLDRGAGPGLPGALMSARGPLAEAAANGYPESFSGGALLGSGSSSHQGDEKDALTRLPAAAAAATPKQLAPASAMEAAAARGEGAPAATPAPRRAAPLVPTSGAGRPAAAAAAVAANGPANTTCRAGTAPSSLPASQPPQAAAAQGAAGSLGEWDDWEAVYEDSCTGRQYTLDACYVVLCTGLYATPFIPTIPGQALYRGLQVHSRDFTDAGVAAGKRVLVLGAGKTAVDVVTELTATSTADSVTLLYRRPHWPLPRFVGPVSIKMLAYTRLLSRALLPYYYDAGPGQRAAAACLTPLRKAFWVRFMGRVNRALGVKKTLGTPDRPICQDIWYSGQVLDAVRWPEVIHNPKVQALQGEVDHFTPVSAVLQDGTELQPDIVLYATGYSNHYTFLEPDVRRALDVQHDGLYLYRHCLVPGLEGLAFVGAEVSTFNNILTAALQAEWLAAALCGRVALPPAGAMAADVAAQRAWRRRTMPPHKLRGSSVMLYMLSYHDQLLRDMGLPTHRKRPTWRHPLAECLEPYTAEDYTDVFAPAAAAKSPHATPRPSSAEAASVAALQQHHLALQQTSVPQGQPQAAVVAAAAAADGPTAAERLGRATAMEVRPAQAGFLASVDVGGGQGEVARRVVGRISTCGEPETDPDRGLTPATSAAIPSSGSRAPGDGGGLGWRASVTTAGAAGGGSPRGTLAGRFLHSTGAVHVGVPASSLSFRLSQAPGLAGFSTTGPERRQASCLGLSLLYGGGSGTGTAGTAALAAAGDRGRRRNTSLGRSSAAAPAGAAAAAMVVAEDGAEGGRAGPGLEAAAGVGGGSWRVGMAASGAAACQSRGGHLPDRASAEAGARARGGAGAAAGGPSEGACGAGMCSPFATRQHELLMSQMQPRASLDAHDRLGMCVGTGGEVPRGLVRAATAAGMISAAAGGAGTGTGGTGTGTGGGGGGAGGAVRDMYGSQGDLDEQDTLYSLDALPPALQAFRRPRVRLQTPLAAYDSSAAAAAVEEEGTYLGGGVSTSRGRSASGSGMVAAASGVLRSADASSAIPAAMVTATAAATQRTSAPTTRGLAPAAVSRVVHVAPSNRASPRTTAALSATLQRAFSVVLRRERSETGTTAVGGGGTLGTASVGGVAATGSHGAAAAAELAQPSALAAADPRVSRAASGTVSGVGSPGPLSRLRASMGGLAVGRKTLPGVNPAGPVLTAGGGGGGGVGGPGSGSLPRGGSVAGYPPQDNGPAAAGAAPGGSARALSAAAPAARIAAGTVVPAVSAVAAAEGPRAVPASSLNGLVMERSSFANSSLGSGSSDGAGSGGGARLKRRRGVKRGFSLAALLMRNRATNTYDVSSSRIEPSSSAVSELAYKVLPPKHVEEAMAAAAAAARRRKSAEGQPPPAPPPAPPAAPVTPPAPAKLSPLHHTSRAALSPSQPPPAQLLNAGPPPAGPPAAQALQPRITTVAAPPPLPPPLLPPPRRPSFAIPAAHAHAGQSAAQSSDTSFFSEEVALPPARPQAVPSGATRAGPRGSSGGDGAGAAVMANMHANRPPSVSASSGISYMPSCSTTSFPHWPEMMAAAAAAAGQAALYVDHTHRLPYASRGGSRRGTANGAMPVGNTVAASTVGIPVVPGRQSNGIVAAGAGRGVGSAHTGSAAVSPAEAAAGPSSTNQARRSSVFDGGSGDGASPPRPAYGPNAGVGAGVSPNDAGAVAAAVAGSGGGGRRAHWVVHGAVGGRSARRSSSVGSSERRRRSSSGSSSSGVSYVPTCSTVIAPQLLRLQQ